MLFRHIKNLEPSTQKDNFISLGQFIILFITPHIIEQKVKGIKAVKEDKESQQQQKDCEEFIEKYRVRGGNCYNKVTRMIEIPVMWGSSPDKSLLVRALENQGIRDLYESFMKGLLPMVLIGITWSDFPSPLNRLKDLNNIDFDLAACAPPRPIMMIDGNHRTHALQEAHSDFPKKALYKTLKLILLVLPKTRQNIQMCLFIGNSRNYAAQVYVKTTQWSATCQFRRQWEELEADTTLSHAERQREFAAYKVRTQPKIHFEPNTCHTFSALCQVDERVWDMMVIIFSGRYTLNNKIKGQTTPKAMTHFVAMTNIPVDKLCAWLQKIIDGQWITSTFFKRCKFYNKQMKVAAQMLEYIQIVRPKYNFQSLPGVAIKYPDVLDVDWMNTVVNSCDDKIKDKLSPHAVELIEAMLARQEKKDNEPKVCCVV